MTDTDNAVIESPIPTDYNTAAIGLSDNDVDKIPSLDRKKKKKKKGGPFSFFRAALVAMRSDSKKKPAPKPEVDASNEKWKKIVGSMRPLHLQENQSPPPSLPPPSPARLADSLEDLNLIQQPSSPSPSSLSGGTMSQYASASNLQELDDSDGESHPDEVFDAICGDDMIDAKAEEFIAQFYRQMKLQHHDHDHDHDHHHHHDHNYKAAMWHPPAGHLA